MTVDDLVVCLHDTHTRRWCRVPVDHWIDTAYADTLSGAMSAHAATVGGSVILSGTAEAGALTVYAAEGARVFGCEWCTVTVEELTEASRPAAG